MKKGKQHKVLGKIATAVGVAGVVAAVGAAVYALSDSKRRDKALKMLEDAKIHGENFLKSVGEVVNEIREEAPEKVADLQKRLAEAKKALTK